LKPIEVSPDLKPTCMGMPNMITATHHLDVLKWEMDGYSTGYIDPNRPNVAYTVLSMETLLARYCKELVNRPERFIRVGNPYSEELCNV